MTVEVHFVVTMETHLAHKINNITSRLNINTVYNMHETRFY
jgi:hypothetical protein